MEVKIGPILFSLALLGFISFAVKFVKWAWLKPKKLEKLLREQGLNGNPYRLLIGDMVDLVSATKQEQSKSIEFSDHLPPHTLPYYHRIATKYGDNPFMWFGPSPRLIVSDPDLMKEILTKPDVFHKPHPDPVGEKIAGGLLLIEDEKWAKHRRIINPAFHVEKLKNLVWAIRLSCSKMVDKWEAAFSGSDESKEIDVWPYLENMSGDVISRAAFGSNYDEGARIFELQKENMKLVLEILKFIYIPGWRFMPTKTNRRMNANNREIQSLLRGIINQREKAVEMGESFGDDLLGTLMESNLKEIDKHGKGKNMGMSTEDVMEECRLFYLAGSETTSVLLLWTMVMLSKHQDWQSRARQEVSQVFGENEPTSDGLNRLKIVTMIVNEVLRLYSPAPMVSRSPTKPVKLGNITLPYGVDLLLLIGMLHNDPRIWGDDVSEFKPERFGDGILSATKGQLSFIPFGSGPRICIGQQFAVIEVKLALAMILQRFSFELSPSYVHAPFPIITLHPQYGAPLILHRL